MWKLQQPYARTLLIGKQPPRYVVIIQMLSRLGKNDYFSFRFSSYPMQCSVGMNEYILCLFFQTIARFNNFGSCGWACIYIRCFFKHCTCLQSLYITYYVRHFWQAFQAQLISFISERFILSLSLLYRDEK